MMKKDTKANQITPTTPTREVKRERHREEKRESAQARRFTEEQRTAALALIAGGMAATEVAKQVGTTTESLRLWKRAAVARGAFPATDAAQASEGKLQATAAADEARRMAAVPRSPYAPAPGAQALSEPQIAAILEWKKKHPVMGPAQLRAQLRRFHGWRIAIKAIARVLKAHGYVLEARGKRARGEPPQRFEAPRPNALWQADFTEVRVHDDRLYVLVMLDDFSRFVVGWALIASPSTSAAVETLRAAMARHGKPEAIRTDRGGAFVAFTREGDFGRVLEAELIDHIVGRAYQPKGGGKVESAIRTLKRELWEVEEFRDREHAAARLREFFREYNEGRAHLGINGVTPADRYFGRADRVLAQVQEAARGRHAVLASMARPGSPVEELGVAGAPLEVLRLVVLDGMMELRFCGSRVVLGRVES